MVSTKGQCKETMKQLPQACAKETKSMLHFQKNDFKIQTIISSFSKNNYLNKQSIHKIGLNDGFRLHLYQQNNKKYHRKKMKNIIRQDTKNSNKRNIERPPYEIETQIGIEYVGRTSYFNILQSQCQALFTILKDIDLKLLHQQIYVFVVDIQPENIQTTVQKTLRELQRFLLIISEEISEMSKNCLLGGQSKKKLVSFINLLRNINFIESKKNLDIYADFCNLVAANPFLQKTEVFLRFIEHSLPINLWKLKLFCQVETNKITEEIETKKKSQSSKFISVSNEGIIISSANPINSLIQFMIPFSNQLSHEIATASDEIIFSIYGCRNQSIHFNFKKDLLSVIKFGLGLQRAIRASQNKQNRFDSFSRPRKNCFTKLYNDGYFYFYDLYHELKKSKKQVFITDWWMTPYVLLKRQQNCSIELNKQNRLDGILEEIAQRGVKIYIVLFKEPLGLICNDSAECQQYLQSLHPNIKVRRHPNTPQFWTHHQKCVVIDQKIGFMGGLDICYGRWDTPDHFLYNKNNYWDGADYVNQRKKIHAPGTTKNFTETPINRQTQCRMPWHDIGVMLKGDAVIDLARHFIQYWYFADIEGNKLRFARDINRRFSRVKQQADVQYQLAQGNQDCQLWGKFFSFFKNTSKFITGSTQLKLRQLLIQQTGQNIEGTQQLQLCRSASEWSIGAKNSQQSIHFAYQVLIDQSEHLIYIENQFFMGQENQIVERLALRIKRAHQKSQNFKIVVVLPLLPGCEGNIEDRNNSILRYQVHNQYKLINRGQNSLYSKINRYIQDPNFKVEDYLFFFSLRGHAKINGVPLTQMIYVHSKLMIVDDKRAIVGSANINDRSLRGMRDSELALVIQEDNGNIKDSKLRRGQIFNLRYRLFEQHFGLTIQQTANSNNPYVWAKMINNAKRNTCIYRQIFKCYPDNIFTISQEIQERQIDQKQVIQFYNQLSSQIFAHAVQFPLRFLSDQYMGYEKFKNKESFVIPPEGFL